MPSTVTNALLLPAVAANYANPVLPPRFLQQPIISQDNTPPDNHVTDSGATLGRVLFYDKRLSINHTIACASCHQQVNGFSDPHRFSTGFAGGLTGRNSMGLANARWYQRRAFFWDELNLTNGQKAALAAFLRTLTDNTLAADPKFADPFNYGSCKGCPRSTGATLPTFEEFASIIGGIVMTSLFADPIAKPNVVLDEVEQGWITLFKLLAENVPDGGFVEYSTDDVLEKAEESGLIDVICGDMSALKAPKVALGKRITKWLGRQFHDDSGRLFEFGKRHATPGKKYGVRILTSRDSAAGAVEHHSA